MAWADSTTDYTYVGAGKRVTSSPSSVIAYENPSAMPSGIDIVFADAHVEFREMRWAVETILQDRARFAAATLPVPIDPSL